MTIQYQIAEKYNFILINCENSIQKIKKKLQLDKGTCFLVVPFGQLEVIFFSSINHSYRKYQTTSTFSLKPLVGATFALKALLNSRSSLPLASDDVMTYTPLPGRWYPHSL